eukprot:TRINITY_DN1441_c1_g2_i4.p1 TRINITY_DN1441_c1_g2~~TRINITY_DN1441_c1_g2_i4.p1  ORF type:complete len:1388 (-),score=486.72 TRINITY_DN1441_c1_g2_i4:112-4029(-)
MEETHKLEKLHQELHKKMKQPKAQPPGAGLKPRQKGISSSSSSSSSTASSHSLTLDDGFVMPVSEIPKGFEDAVKQSRIEDESDATDSAEDIQDQKDSSARASQTAKATRRRLSSEEAYSYDPNKLNVFIIAHSHCDPGWLSTFEGYFEREVKMILDNVVDALFKNPKRKFNWAEISFFSLWYDALSDFQKNRVKQLVQRGQLEFVHGGWVQNDEANAHYDAVITQVEQGHAYLEKTLGVKPRVGWQIDPFGHSALTPSLFAQMGYDAMVINRIPFYKKAEFKNTKRMEFIWRGSGSLGKDTEILTHVLHTHYSAPRGFDWEEGAPPLYEGSTLVSRAQMFAGEMKNRANAYRTNNLLVPFGDDFKFKNAEGQFGNMDKLIDHINSGGYGINIQYGTVANYFDAVKKAELQKPNIRFPIFTADFYPYADNAQSYWSGFYTSRPKLKRLAREADSMLRSAEILHSLARSDPVLRNRQFGADTQQSKMIDWSRMFHNLRRLRRESALLQHHDAITGTCKSFVVEDYLGRLDAATREAKETAREMVQILLSGTNKPVLSENPTKIVLPSGQLFPVVVTNSLAMRRVQYVSVYVDSPDVIVTTGEKGTVVPSDVLPIVAPELDSTKYQLLFRADVQPLGVKTYFLKKGTGKLKATVTKYSQNPNSGGAQGLRGNTRGGAIEEKPIGEGKSEDIFIENEKLRVHFSAQNGRMAAVTLKEKGQRHRLEHQFMQYSSTESGAYIFRPQGQANPVDNGLPILIVTKGRYVQQALVLWGKRKQNVRVYDMQNSANNDMAYVMDVRNDVTVDVNRELVTRYSTSLQTANKFFTDNGLEMRPREYSQQRPQPSNFYPSLSTVYIEDSAKRLTILTTQPQGVSSAGSGQVETMIHRSLSRDDGRGLGEAMMDHATSTVFQWLTFGEREESDELRHRLMLMLNSRNQVFYSKRKVNDAKEWGSSFAFDYEPVNGDNWPSNIHLLSMKARDAVSDDIMIRLNHMSEHNEQASKQWTSATRMFLNKVFKTFKVDSVRERTLCMNYDLEDRKQDRHTFNADEGEVLTIAPSGETATIKLDSQNTEEEGVFISDAALQNKAGRRLLQVQSNVDLKNVVLKPTQIRSFYIRLVPTNGDVGNLAQLTEADSLPKGGRVSKPAVPTNPVKRTQRPKRPVTAPPVKTNTNSNNNQGQGNLGSNDNANNVNRVNKPYNGHAKPDDQPPTPPVAAPVDNSKLEPGEEGESDADWDPVAGKMRLGMGTNELWIIIGLTFLGFLLIVMVFIKLFGCGSTFDDEDEDEVPRGKKAGGKGKKRRAPTDQKNK